jgi:hypothetical protein
MKICPSIVFKNRLELIELRKPRFESIQEIIFETSEPYDMPSMMKNIEYFT